MNSEQDTAVDEVLKPGLHSALQTYEQVLTQAQGRFVERAGQREMVGIVAQVCSTCTLGKTEEEPQRSFAVIQAGTGVGKSLAYAVPAIAVALQRQTRVIISTATVALQEQLVHKDLPLLRALMPQAFSFALAKGRGRYVCNYKLSRWIHGDIDSEADAELPAEQELDLFPVSSSESSPQPPPTVPLSRAPDLQEKQIAFYKDLAEQLNKRHWDGDRDTLPTMPEASWWSSVAAHASSCSAKHCPEYHACAYFNQRKKLANAHVIVANHDLLLSTLEGNTLPPVSDCLLILDEAHHLPAIALSQFQENTHLSQLRWVGQLAQRAHQTAQALNLEGAGLLPEHGRQLHQQLQAIVQFVVEHYKPPELDPAAREPVVAQLPIGPLPSELQTLVEAAARTCAAFLKILQVVALELRTRMKEQPQEAHSLTRYYVQLGLLAPRLESTQAWATLMLESAQVPAARWFSFGVQSGYLSVTASASPVQPAQTLRHQLWSRARAVVMTSATLTSCGNFDFFLHETGLYAHPDVRTHEVSSPFDFARQGRFIAVHTRADPKNSALYNPAMCDELMRDLEQVRAGALVLFTSRDQMRCAVERLPGILKDRVLVQNEYPRQKLLQKHESRVQQGQASIIFGMQSFGEGLDLPGALCETVLICKLPFAPPSDPVGAARAQWLRSKGRDPVMELVVPAVSIRLAQWVGRAIRSETDQAHIYCYDRRLLTTSFGQRLLAGLPAFTKLRRTESGELVAL